MVNDFIMSPKVDFAFKELMKDGEVRKGFLSAVLNLPVEEIKDTVILDSYLRKKSKEEKLGILDVRVLLNNEAEIDIEIQVEYFKEWKKRSLFYWAKMFTESLEEGESYKKLRPCICISVLDFKLDMISDDFFSCYQLLEKERHTSFTDLIAMYVIELPKLSKEIKELDDVYLWAKFIASEKKEEMEMLAKQNSQLGSAYSKLQELSQDKEKRMEYEARQRAIRDTLSFQEQYREEGLEMGRLEGLEQGREQGLEQGLEQGRAEALIENIGKVITKYKKGLSIDTVAEHLELDILYTQDIFGMLEEEPDLSANKLYDRLHNSIQP